MRVVTDLFASNADQGGSFGPGLLGFLILAGFAVAVVVIYLSLRKNLRRIDFNPEGRTDAERMRGHDVRRNGAGLPGDVDDLNVRKTSDDGDGHP